MVGVAGKEMVINNVIVAMQALLSSVQLQVLETALRESMSGYRLEEECTALATSMDDNDYILKLFAANKKLEGCARKSIEQYVRQTRNFLEHVNKNYKDVTKDDVKLYLAWYGRGKSPNTISNAKRFMGSFFSWAHDEGYISSNPVRAIKGIKPILVENVHLTLEEEIAVREAAGESCKRDRAIISLLLSTGLRVGEIEALNRSDIRFRDRSITLRSEKSNRFRTVYLDVWAQKHLEEYLQTRQDNCEALFVTHRQYRNIYGICEGKRLGKKAYEDICKEIAMRAGITDKSCTVHVFRRTFATRLADRGCPLEVIQELMGHADAGTTKKHYIATNTVRTKRVAEQYLLAA